MRRKLVLGGHGSATASARVFIDTPEKENAVALLTGMSTDKIREHFFGKSCFILLKYRPWRYRRVPKPCDGPGAEDDTGTLEMITLGSRTYED